MLRSLKQLVGYRIHASDGELGQAQDFYFDDHTWRVRYLVVNLEGSPLGEEVLISPTSVEEPDWERQIIPVALTVGQVRGSPSVETDLPVSRQKENALAEYYSWPLWWEAPGMPFPSARATIPAVDVSEQELPPSDPCLRSVVEVSRYSVEASDGRIGRVADFIVQTDVWAIRYIVIRTRKWLPGRMVLASPAWLRQVDWDRRLVHMDQTCEDIKNSPPFAPSAPVNREYEGRLHDYYGRPRYWESEKAGSDGS
jgi:hypothetical protein